MRGDSKIKPSSTMPPIGAIPANRGRDGRAGSVTRKVLG
jgi:hypothetical protein